ncbi:MAG: DUF5662 family protein [Candidatus Paceibacterota bacterium]
MNIEFEVLTDTLLHIGEVQENLEIFIGELRQRGLAHDRTKLQELEFDAFVSTRPKFKKANYGSPEYQECVDAIKPAIDHHYQLNRHHTAFHQEGINEMNLIDILEMVADWRAAARRSPTQTFEQSLDYAFNKYKIDEQLKGIILHTLKDLNWV